MYKLVISDDEGKTTVVPLVRDEITIGRKEGNTIRLTERNVSRRHARLFKANGAFTIEDLGSYNGIKLNGRKIGEPASLKAGDQVTIGDYLLALQVDAAEASTEPTTPIAAPETANAETAMLAAPADEPIPPARVVMLSPPAPGAEFALSKQRVRFGRAEDLDAWVNHRSISREHAEIVQEEGGYKIVDLGSANGLRVNGQDTSEARLEAGDVVEMGQVRFRFVGRGEAYTFDADRTIQMEAVPAGGSRAPILAALGIIVVAVAIGGVIAMGGGSADEEVVTAIEQTPNEMGGSVDPSTGAPTSPAAENEEAFREALSSCQTALEERRYEDAVSQGTAALALAPGDEHAHSCKTRAEAGHGEAEVFARANSLLDGGEIDDAYFAFEELPADSPFRESPEYQRAKEEFAEFHVREGRRALRSNPDEAVRHANMVRNLEDPPEEALSEAEAIIRDRRRVLTNQQPRQPRQPRQARSTQQEETPRETGGGDQQARPANPLLQCLQTANYNQCIIQNLPNPRTAREYEALVEAYRQTGNQGAAFRHMETYCRRWEDTPTCRSYRQILAAHGRTP